MGGRRRWKEGFSDVVSPSARGGRKREQGKLKSGPNLCEARGEGQDRRLRREKRGDKGGKKGVIESQEEKEVEGMRPGQERNAGGMGMYYSGEEKENRGQV